MPARARFIEGKVSKINDPRILNKLKYTKLSKERVEREYKTKHAPPQRRISKLEYLKLKFKEEKERAKTSPLGYIFGISPLARFLDAIKDVAADAVTDTLRDSKYSPGFIKEKLKDYDYLSKEAEKTYATIDAYKIARMHKNTDVDIPIVGRVYESLTDYFKVAPQLKKDILEGKTASVRKFAREYETVDDLYNMRGDIIGLGALMVGFGAVKFAPAMFSVGAGLFTGLGLSSMGKMRFGFGIGGGGAIVSSPALLEPPEAGETITEIVPVQIEKKKKKKSIFDFDFDFDFNIEFPNLDDLF